MRLSKPLLAGSGCALALLVFLGHDLTGSDSGFAFSPQAVKSAHSTFEAQVTQEDKWRTRVRDFAVRGVDAPLLSGAGQADEHAFVHETAAGPVRWNPCAPIRYKLNVAAAPAGFEADVTESLRRISAITGLHFAAAGVTSTIPQAATKPGGSGAEPDADLVIAVVPAAKSTLLGGGAAARTQNVWSGDRIVGAATAIDATALRGRRPGFAGPHTYGSLLAHELGHVVGLSHVRGRTEVMSESTDVGASYGAGDLAGLLELGDGAGCLR